MPTKAYPLWNNKELKVPALWSRNGMSIKKSITWNPQTTDILSARLDIIIDPSVGYVKAWVEHNLTEIQRWWWVINDATPKSDSVDIIGTLYNGPNLFKFVGAKEFANPVIVLFVVTASVVIEYTGDEPEFGTDWAEMLREAAYGVAIGGGGYIVVSSVAEIAKEKR